jgi:hypothetical protein
LKKNKPKPKKEKNTMTNTELLESVGMLEDVREYVEENDIETSIDDMTPKEIIDAYFTWNGVVGYTDDIITIVSLFLDDVEPIDFEI